MTEPARQMQKIEPQTPIVSESTAIVAMIERAARDPAVDIDKMERLLMMQERVLAKRDEQAFNGAMAAAQTEMRPVAADAENKQTSSKYASFAALDNAVRPIYSKHGFSLSFNTEPGAPENHIRVVCFAANGGFTRKYQIDMPADGKGAKGGDVMTKTHAAGAAMTYGQRYLLKMIFNLAVGRDDDGNAAGNNQDFITDDQVKVLTKLIENGGGNVEKFCKFAKVEKLGDIFVSRYEAAVAAVNRATADRKAAAK